MCILFLQNNTIFSVPKFMIFIVIIEQFCACVDAVYILLNRLILFFFFDEHVYFNVILKNIHSWSN